MLKGYSALSNASSDSQKDCLCFDAHKQGSLPICHQLPDCTRAMEQRVNSQFKEQLNVDLQALHRLTQKPGFGVGQLSIGAELELYIIDENFRPLSMNKELLQDAHDKRLTLELNRYNLEFNATPYSLTSLALQATEHDIEQQLQRLNHLAQRYQGRVLPIGILPTLKKSDVGPKYVTDFGRYQKLVEKLREWRGEHFDIHIQGRETLHLPMPDISLEGANTSFQVHLKVQPENFSNMFNAAQLTTPLVLALSGNSPLLFGRKLWHETRIPLFQQSVDTRRRSFEPARVSFGHGWVQNGALELFTQAVRLYPPLLPDDCHENALDSLDHDEIPQLKALKTHCGTVWSWNRPVYDHQDGGHFRIEFRSLPAGPTPIDMVANAAFAIGLAQGMAVMMPKLLPVLPFHLAENNFYESARLGLDARVVWPKINQFGCQDCPITEVIADCIPVAIDGLCQLGVDQAEIDRYMSVIDQRLQTRQTGSTWQLAMLDYYEQQQGVSREKALQKMLARYSVLSTTNQPIALWERPK